MTASRLITLVLALCTTGCLGINNGHPEDRGPRNVESRLRFDRAYPELWQQVYLGSPPKPQHVGYVKTETTGRNRGTHWIYDTDFHLIGRVSARGQTIKLTRRGDKNVGGFALKHAILRIHGRTKETEVGLISMPNPRG